MKISSIHIIGFRNFDDEQITFQDKTLIIGANDVGKTNLIYALRLLFDKSISERDLELSDSDYNAYSGTMARAFLILSMRILVPLFRLPHSFRCSFRNWQGS